MAKKPMINSGSEKFHFPFSSGDSVELCSDDQGFCGAWYEAKLIRTIPKKQRCLIEYSSLLSSTDETKLLREYVDLSNLRPPAPRRAANAPPFEVYDKVEAFHSEGWWPAVITEVKHGNSKEKCTATVKYVVAFPTTRETEEFSPKEIRPFLVWKDGVWNEAEDHEGEAKIHFDVGKLVEVSGDKEHFGASWFIATVKKIINGSTLIVEYDKLKGVNKDPLVEILDVQYVRPIPPELNETYYRVFDKVEAFYADRWISASVKERLSETKYLISSNHFTDDVMEFHRSDLRYCQDWNDGCWVQVSTVKRKRSRYPTRASRRRQVQATSERPTTATPSTSNDGNDECVLQRSVVKTSGVKADNGPYPSLASMKSMKRKSMQDHRRLLSCKLDRRRPSLVTGKSVDSANSMEIHPASNQQYINAHSSKERGTLSDEKTVSSPSHCDSLPLPESNFMVIEQNDKITSSLKDTQLEIRQTSPDPVRQLLHEPSVGKIHLKLDAVELDPNIESILKLPDTQQLSSTDVVVNSCGEKESWLLQEPRENIYREIEIPENERCLSSQKVDHKDHAHSQDARKCALPDIQTMSSTNSATNLLSGEDDLSVLKETGLTTHPMTYVNDSSTRPEVGSYNDSCTPTSKRIPSPLRQMELSNAIVVRLDRNEEPLSSNSRSPGRKRKADEDGNAGFLPGNDNVVPIRIEESSPGDSVSTGQNRASLPNSTIIRKEELLNMEEFTEPGSKRKTDDIVQEDLLPIIQSSLVTYTEQTCNLFEPPCGPPCKRFRLPFMKNSVLWRSIESMDVFHVMPQEPHFRPLDKHPESLREGMAIGLMVAFTTVVEDISKLKILDPEVRFLDIFQSLYPLEENGFDIHKIRCRLDELLELKRCMQLSNTKKAESEEKILELRNSKVRLDALIVSLDKGIVDRERELKSLREQRASVKREGMMVDSEVDNVARDVEAAELAASLAQSRFVALQMPNEG